jgi:hypothetical protein
LVYPQLVVYTLHIRPFLSRPSKELPVSRTNAGPSEGEGLLYAREELAADIDSILKGDEHSPEALAHLFLHLARAIEGGLEGINRAGRTLVAAIDLIYPHSSAHALGLRLYRLSLEGRLRVEDEPVRLIGAAVERYAGRG